MWLGDGSRWACRPVIGFRREAQLVAHPGRFSNRRRTESAHADAPERGIARLPANGATVAPGVAPGLPPAGATVAPGTTSEMNPAPPPATYAVVTTDRSVLEVIRASIFDDIYSPEAQTRWTPLPLSTFFSEGWDVPFALPPKSERIGWINAFGGVFFRAWFFESFYANGIGRFTPPGHNGNQFIQDFTIFVPFNRRFEIQFDSLFIVSNKGGKSNTYHTNWGDTVIHPRLNLSESENFGQLLEMGIRTPTGRTENGNGVTSLFPQWSIWWNPVGHWAVRATTGVNIPVAKNSGYTSYYNLLGVGYTFPGNPDRFIHNCTFYLVAEDSATITGTPRHENLFTLLPGLVSQLGKKLWFGYAGIQVPMTGPTAYTYQAIWAIVHAY